MSSRDLEVEGECCRKGLGATSGGSMKAESGLFLDVGGVMEIESLVTLSKLTVCVCGGGGGGRLVCNPLGRW